MSRAAETSHSTEDRADRYARAAATLRQWLADADQEDDREYDWSATECELAEASTRPDVER